MCRVTVIYKSLLLNKMNKKCHPTVLNGFPAVGQGFASWKKRAEQKSSTPAAALISSLIQWCHLRYFNYFGFHYQLPPYNDDG